MAHQDRTASSGSVTSLLDRLAEILRQRPDRIEAFHQALPHQQGSSSDGTQEKDTSHERGVIPFKPDTTGK